MSAQRTKLPLGVVDVNVAPMPAPTKKGTKRKSTDAPAADPAPSAKKAKAEKEAATAELLDVSMISLDDDLDEVGEVRVYDTCNTVRRKIRAFMTKHSITQAAFMRAITAAAFPDGSRKIQHTQLATFLRGKGPLKGNTSVVFYAAYVFFEKLRIKDKKPKAAERKTMESLHPNGVDRERNADGPFFTFPGEVITMDRYGVVSTSRRH
ncbi:hypothetical protein QBC47DRAFT_404218 [Echria macrotheca]|uniref:DUF7726 domain-containing protein n=1 Tax=Echria macrotheca TaxID=438768 RepID=A0AAJ0F2Y1_9PEZI|nr:hypothetical protein QBC47DRAFT_404218 [Echria macrotheca]